MKKRLGSMQDIALLCGVSVSTVSRVLNNAPGISSETRRRVLEAVQSGDFTPQKRRRPITRTMIKLVLVIPDRQQVEMNPFYDSGELLTSINNAFQKEKKQVEVITFSELGSWFGNPSSEADGFILAFGDIPVNHRESLIKMKIPYIFLNRTFSGESYVSCNNFRGMLDLGAHLVERGCCSLGYLGYGPHPVNVDRLRGFRTVLQENGMRGCESNVYTVEHISEITELSAKYFIRKKCDAVMAFNDNFAIRFITALSVLGREVPRDMAVTGFDNSPMRSLFKPSITTISLSIYDMGFLAARWLRDNIMHRETRSVRLEVDGRLIEGDSVGKTRGS